MGTTPETFSYIFSNQADFLVEKENKINKPVQAVVG